MELDSQMLAFPIRFVNGKAQVVERDSYDEIAQGIEITCRTRSGERIEAGREEFGIPSFVFDDATASAVSAEQVHYSIIDADPRASVVVDADDDTSDLAAMMVRIGVLIEEGDNG